ncbi:transporter substrate-binding domain-containing protein [Desulfobotulus mexicanus]|uniref:Transporter substrate-binding domain-containing protein n=1 Tax=Desulfobotulus mexicanus TaxID=2586642 RepID=A0A5S5MFA1_9BACT|nr:transporter substrate-binding domain-containing protein [Desulfobotulus mexicanus]TYT74359.1 transporter substrate-binding domain-containing protein [Desulfobotulus mexicanus]
MNKLFSTRRLIPLLLLLILVGVAYGNEFKASLANMPVYAESADKGVIVDLVKAIETVSGNKISISVYPFARSMHNVITGQYDFHIPLIKNELISENDLEYYFSTETIFHVNFVLYTIKDSPIALENLYRYTIETDRAHVNYFPFKILPSNSIEGSLKKLSVGRIDGWIFADTATDPILKKLDLKNIERTLYKRFEVKVILPKSKMGKETDAMLTKAIADLKKSSKFKEIMQMIDLPFDPWQP